MSERLQPDTTSEVLRPNPALTFVEVNDPVLRQKAEVIPVNEIQSDEVKAIIKAMLVIGKGEQGNPEKPYLVGLAAPQVGISKRIILVALGQDGEKREITPLTAFINPSITWASKERNEYRENCFSVPRSMQGVVPRSNKIQVKAYDRDGNKVNHFYKDYEARIFQHEIDHLDGKVFIDRVEDPSKLHVVTDEDQMRYREDWQTWGRVFDKEEFEFLRYRK